MQPKPFLLHRAFIVPLAVAWLLTGTGPEAFAEDTLLPQPQASTIRSALERADEAWTELVRLLHRLTGDPSAMPPAVQQMDKALADLREGVSATQQEMAMAFVRMASYTAWLVHTESRKVPASRRLIQLTRTTGRTEEVERYEQRHEALLANINAAANQYALALSALARLEGALVDAGFAQYELQLVEMGLVEQIRLNHLVRAHVGEYARIGEADLPKWKHELEQLLPVDERSDGEQVQHGE